jgi:uncharacterized membrane protein YraQ (UPF0718 family)
MPEILEEREITSKQLANARNKLKNFLTAIEQQDIPDEITGEIHAKILGLNQFKGSEKEVEKFVEHTYQEIIYLLKEKLNMVPRNHYRNYWSVYGLCIFGLPMGVIFSAFTKNNASMAYGLPVGFLIGFIIGKHKDKKAEREKKVIG